MVTPQPLEPSVLMKLRGEALDAYLRAALDTILHFPREYTVLDVRSKCPIKTHPAHPSRVLYLLRKAGLIREVRREVSPNGNHSMMVVNRSEDAWLLGKFGDPREFAFTTIRDAWTYDLRIANAAQAEARKVKVVSTSVLERQAEDLARQVKKESESSKVSEVKKLEAAVKRERALLKIETLKKQLKKLQDRRKKIGR